MSTTTIEEGRRDDGESGGRNWLYVGIALLIGFAVALVVAQLGGVWVFLVTAALIAGITLLYVRNRRAEAELQEAKAALEEANAESERTRAKLGERETELKETRATLGEVESNLDRTRAKLGETIILLDDCIESGSDPALRKKLEETEDKLRVAEKNLEDANEDLEDTRKKLRKCIENSGKNGDDVPILPLVIENVESNDDVWVKLTNEGKKTIQLGGCSMVDGDGTHSRFREGDELDPNDSETFEVDRSFDIESDDPVTLSCDDEPIGRIRWRR